MNVIGLPSKQLVMNETVHTGSVPQGPIPKRDQRVQPVASSSKTDTHSQSQFPTTRPPSTETQPQEEAHAAPPSALQLKISSMLEQQMQEQLNESVKEGAPKENVPSPGHSEGSKDAEDRQLTKENFDHLFDIQESAEEPRDDTAEKPKAPPLQA